MHHEQLEEALDSEFSEVLPTLRLGIPHEVYRPTNVVFINNTTSSNKLVSKLTNLIGHQFMNRSSAVLLLPASFHGNVINVFFQQIPGNAPLTPQSLHRKLTNASQSLAEAIQNANIKPSEKEFYLKHLASDLLAFATHLATYWPPLVVPTTEDVVVTVPDQVAPSPWSRNMEPASFWVADASNIPDTSPDDPLYSQITQFYAPLTPDTLNQVSQNALLGIQPERLLTVDQKFRLSQPDPPRNESVDNQDFQQPSPDYLGKRPNRPSKPPKPPKIAASKKPKAGTTQALFAPASDLQRDVAALQALGMDSRGSFTNPLSGTSSQFPETGSYPEV